MDAYLTPDEVAAQIGHVSAYTVLEARRRGLIAGTLVGKRYLFREADVLAWLDTQRTPVKTGPRAQLTAGAVARKSRAS